MKIMEQDRRLRFFEENKNQYVESEQRQARVTREEVQKRNVYHGNMIQLYKSKRKRDYIIKQAEKRHLDTVLIEQAKEISERNPFDTSTVTVMDLECLNSLELFVNNVPQDNVFSQVVDRIGIMIYGENPKDRGGDL